MKTKISKKNLRLMILLTNIVWALFLASIVVIILGLLLHPVVDQSTANWIMIPAFVFVWLAVFIINFSAVRRRVCEELK